MIPVALGLLAATLGAMAPPAAPGGAAARTGRQTAPPPGPTVSLIDAVILPRGLVVDGTPVGGLSALAYDVDRDELLALSDAGPRSRFYTFRVRLADGLDVTPTGVTLLRDPDGNPLAADLDPEGLAVSPRGTILVASEGGRIARRVASPAIYEFARDGRLLGALAVPRRYRLATDPQASSGVRFNHAFESLTIPPSGARLLTATETALIEDRAGMPDDEGAPVRLLEYAWRNGGFEPRREEVYPVDPLRVPSDLGPHVGENGLVDLLAIGERDVVALERSFARRVVDTAPASYQNIRLYLVRTGTRPDVMTRASLADGAPIAPLAKHLLFEFDDRQREHPGVLVDNYEGLSLGPTLADGARTLILVSDDNFSESQRTVFLALRLD